MLSGFSMLMLTLAFTARAAELKQETVEAWQEYIRSTAARMQERLRPDNHFLNIDKQEELLARVRSGEILVLPGGSQSVKKVPSGLIHDWVGTAFITYATLNEVMAVVRDYNRYKEFYPPSVVDSRTLARAEHEDRFSMMLTNRSLFLATALDGDYKCSYFQVSDRRAYNITQTTRLQEIENYGTREQHSLREDEGNGLIWRLFSITRFEERDGGVYIELEAIALSREIPFSLRWVVEPIVRRVSTRSLATSLRQTEDVVRAGAKLAGWNAPRGACSATMTYSPVGAGNSGAARSFR